MRLRIPSLPARPRLHARATGRPDGKAWFPHPYVRRDRPITLPEAALAGTSRSYAAACRTAGVVGRRARDGFLPPATVSARRPLGPPGSLAPTATGLGLEPPGKAARRAAAPLRPQRESPAR